MKILDKKTNKTGGFFFKFLFFKIKKNPAFNILKK